MASRVQLLDGSDLTLDLDVSVYDKLIMKYFSSYTFQKFIVLLSLFICYMIFFSEKS